MRRWILLTRKIIRHKSDQKMEDSCLNLGCILRKNCCWESPSKWCHKRSIYQEYRFLCVSLKKFIKQFGFDNETAGVPTELVTPGFWTPRALLTYKPRWKKFARRTFQAGCNIDAWCYLQIFAFIGMQISWFNMSRFKFNTSSCYFLVTLL